MIFRLNEKKALRTQGFSAFAYQKHNISLIVGALLIVGFLYR